jgi:hypothetical protein
VRFPASRRIDWLLVAVKACDPRLAAAVNLRVPCSALGGTRERNAEPGIQNNYCCDSFSLTQRRGHLSSGAGWYRSPKAFGIAGGQVIGYGDTYTYFHALLWTSHGLVDLNPSAFEWSAGYATDGAQQVGYGYPSGATGYHALLWSGTADSVVDLHPMTGYTSSSASGVGGGQQLLSRHKAMSAFLAESRPISRRLER